MGASASVVSQQLTLFEEAVLKNIAEIRTREGRLLLIKRLQTRLNHFNGNEYNDPNGIGATKITKEGKAAVHDSIKYLKRGKWIHANDDDTEADEAPTLESEFSTVPCPALRASSEDHCFDVGTVGIASHESSTGKFHVERIQRYGWWREICSEVIFYGTLEVDEKRTLECVAQRVIDDLIVDDGVPSRGHRVALFNPRLKIGGVGLGNHAVFGHIVVVNMADSLLEESDVPELVGDYEGDYAKEEVQRLTKMVRERAAHLVDRQKSGPLQLPETWELLEKRKKDMNAESGTQWGVMGLCCGCGETIRGGRTMEVACKKGNGGGTKKVFHAACFACADCKQSLKGIPFKEKDGCEDMNPFVCETCWSANYAPRCHHCSKPLVKQYVSTSDGNKYHKECYEKVKAGHCSKNTVGNAQGVQKNKTKASKAGAGGPAPKMKTSFIGAKNKMSTIAGDYAALDL